eukprot:3207564-Amphidinium_carterae.1
MTVLHKERVSVCARSPHFPAYHTLEPSISISKRPNSVEYCRHCGRTAGLNETDTATNHAFALRITSDPCGL